MRRIAIVAVAALGLAACSNNGYGGGGSSSSAAPAAAGAATVATASVGSLGTVLVDGTGRTLYLFESDTGSTSTCTGGCAATWPALTTDGDPVTGDGASASMLGTSANTAGGTQVTYNGHPLYLYSGDSASGQANGEGIGGVWYAVTADGTAAQPGGSGTGGGGYGGGGYGNG
jgi:predicted lipoprotein with Yx(FWY)xxD motif